MKLTRQVIREAILREFLLLSEQKESPTTTPEDSGPIDISDEDDEAPEASGPQEVSPAVKKTINNLLFDTDDEGDARDFVTMWEIYGNADNFVQDRQMEEVLRVASGQQENARFLHGEPLLNDDGSPIEPEAAPEPEQTMAAAITVGDYAPAGDPYSYDFTDLARERTIDNGKVYATAVARNGQSYGPATFEVPSSNPLHDMIMSDITDPSSENYEELVADVLSDSGIEDATAGAGRPINVTSGIESGMIEDQNDFLSNHVIRFDEGDMNYVVIVDGFLGGLADDSDYTFITVGNSFHDNSYSGGETNAEWYYKDNVEGLGEIMIEPGGQIPGTIQAGKSFMVFLPDAVDYMTSPMTDENIRMLYNMLELDSGYNGAFDSESGLQDMAVLSSEDSEPGASFQWYINAMYPEGMAVLRSQITNSGAMILPIKEAILRQVEVDTADAPGAGGPTSGPEEAPSEN